MESTKAAQNSIGRDAHVWQKWPVLDCTKDAQKGCRSTTQAFGENVPRRLAVHSPAALS